MAVANTLDQSITDLNSSPAVMPNVTVNGARKRVILGTVEVAAADDDTSVYRTARVHSSWIITSIKVFNDAITAGTVYDVGLYQTAANGGAVLDADCYATNIDLSSASTTGVEVAFEARNIDAIKNKVYQDGGLTTDPLRYYDLALTGDTVGTAAGTISTMVEYAID